MKINENTSLKTDMKTLVMIVMGIGIAVWTYAEINARIVHLETSKQLMEQDLLEASTQKPIDQEQFMLIEDLYKTVEKLEETQEQNMTNKVNIEFLRDQLDKALNDIEKLKDKQREFANGNSH
jgi:small-conductance mechanosensitive channel|tara:strand:- start:511 stop:879 length:369 start_codon:yes stop_codon:yes gene_type:complete